MENWEGDERPLEIVRQVAYIGWYLPLPRCIQ